MRDPYSAIQAIEVLVGGDFGMDMEWILYDKKRKKIDPQLKEAAEVITKIYQIVHAETLHTCKHPDWESIKYHILARENNSKVTP